jgi:molybdopterin-guanine dinucleotide biosynthesis adapter protein
MKMFSIVGWSGSGKTLLITRLIEGFQAGQRGVIAVKSTHAGYALQPEGKDTARFLQAGAREAYLVADGELLRMTRLAAPADLLAELQGRLRPDDIVLLEGFSQPGIPVIEVRDPRAEKGLKTRAADLAAVVGADGGACTCPRFHPDDIEGIRAFMEAYHGK